MRGAERSVKNTAKNVSLIVLVLLLLNFAIYWLCTPEQCLPPFSWAAQSPLPSKT